CPDDHRSTLEEVRKLAAASKTPVLGITGTGGSGKSSLVDELVRRFLVDFKNGSLDQNIAISSVAPSKRKTGGALLGDRIRMNAIHHPQIYMRSLATRQANVALSKSVKDAVDILKAAAFDLIILETSGIGQSDTEVVEHADFSLYVMTHEYGAASQLEKIDMLDFADIIVLNKFDKIGAQDALRDVKKQYRRNHNLWDVEEEQIPVYGTMASQFNDPGINDLYLALLSKMALKCGYAHDTTIKKDLTGSEKNHIIPPSRIRYLSEITENNRAYDKWVSQQKDIAQQLYGIHKSIETIQNNPQIADKEILLDRLGDLCLQLESEFD